MATLQTNTVLRGLKELTGNSDQIVSFLAYTTCFCLFKDYDRTYDYGRYEHEIDAILGMLADDGLIQFIDKDRGQFRLSEKAIHKSQIKLSVVAFYLANKWIDILALVIAILAFLNSYGIDLLAPVITLCTRLPGL